MKNQLYRGKVRGILGQVAETCTDSLDCVLHTSNLVEGHVVDHHNVPPLECWDQTLLYVSQEGLAIHGSFEPHHVGGHCCFIDKFEVGRVKKALLANPASACTRHVGSLALRRPQTFFDGDAMTGEEAGQRATTSWDTPLVKRRNNLIERKIPLRADECENLPRALLPRSVAGNVGTAAPSNPRSRQLPARKVLSLSTGSTHRKTSPSCGPVAMLSGSSIRLPTEAGNRTTRVLPHVLPTAVAVFLDKFPKKNKK